MNWDINNIKIVIYKTAIIKCDRLRVPAAVTTVI